MQGWFANKIDAAKKWFTSKKGEVGDAILSGQLQVEYTDDMDSATLLEAYPKMVHDPAVKAALHTVLYELCALDINVQPADSDDEASVEQAEFVKHVLTTLKGGSAAGLLMKIARPALIYQHSISELVWKSIGRGKHKGKWKLNALKSKDVTSKGFWGYKVDKFKNVEAITQLVEGVKRLYPPAKFVHFSHLPVFENPRGISHIRSAYRAWWVKTVVLRALAVLAEKAGPIPIAKYVDDNQKEGLISELKKFASRRYMAIPKEVEIQIVEFASRAAMQGHERALRYLDKQIFLAIRGAFLQALEGDRTGARSMGEVHESTADLWVWYFDYELAGAINEQIVPQIIDLNYGPDTALPVVSLESPVQEDLKLRAEIDKLLAEMGLPMSRKELYEIYGRKAPEDEDDEIKKAPAAAPGGGFGGSLSLDDGGRGAGQGIGEPRVGDGGAGICVCPECGTEVKHDRGTPCNEIKCPKCGVPMKGKSGESEASLLADREWIADFFFDYRKELSVGNPEK